jgi:hypothetical protein
VTGGDDAKDFGSPESQLKPSAGIMTQASDGAPEVRRQSAQWQWTSDLGSVLISYRTAPQKQPP